MVKKALYLAGGGARGAYQAGVLRAIADLLKVKSLPFDMLSGVSVGSINVAGLAENATDFIGACEKLEALWSEVHIQQIFNASGFALGKSVWRNFTSNFIKYGQSGYLLDTLPLQEFIQNNLNFDDIENNIANKHFETLEILSNCYETQRTVSFYRTHNTQFIDWKNPRHNSQAVKFSFQHILASTSLPLFFPAVRIDDLHYGDGGVGLVSPLHGAISFKADKVLIIGTRKIPTFDEPEKMSDSEIGFARTLGRMLNSVFLDNLDRDIEMVNYMNEIARLLSIWKKRYSPWKPLQTLHLRPSADIGELAQNHYNNLPALLRVLLNTLGAKSHSGDLLSFLLFEREFACELIDLGYKDTLANKETVIKFFDD